MTILTDDEIAKAGKDCFWPLDEDAPKFARAVEATVLAKLTQQAPVAMRYDFDGYGYKYIDSGSGSDWRSRIPDAEAVYAAPLPAAAPEAPAQEIADVWHEGSRSFYRAVLLKKLAPDEVFFDPAGSPAQASAVDERAAFEAWWKGDLLDWRGHQNTAALHAWEGWQARAALAQENVK